MNWIRVEDSLPEEQQECLLKFRSGVKFYGRFLQGDFCSYSLEQDRFFLVDEWRSFYGIAHWLPVPE